MKKLQLTLLSLALATGFTYAQNLKFPAASPHQTVTQAVGISEIGVDYSRPSAKGRVIFGSNGIVPYQTFWRTGANAPTKLTLGADATINGTKIPAGTYSLFTYPNAAEWTVVLNKNLNVYGESSRNKAEDVAVLKVTPQKTNSYVEVFTIDFSKLSSTGATMDITWENTKVPLNIEFDYDAELTQNIEKAMSKDNRPYFSAASYYYNNNKDMNKALTWVSKAYENSNHAYYIGVQKAKIQLKLGDKKGALNTLAEVKQTGGYVHSVAAEIADLEKQAK